MTKPELADVIAHEERAVRAWLDGEGPLPTLLAASDAARVAHYGRRVFFRGLVEISNHCARGCLYCGLRAPNAGLHRYRMDEDAILGCVRGGHGRGFHSFVLQGGEDGWYGGGRMADIVARIKAEFPDSALTLSIGELPEAAYRALREAGADRYLLRHETANADHYARLHPPGMALASRVRCLWTLKELGFKVGAGFMVGSPGQTLETLADDLILLRELNPAMVGIGPFLPQSDTPFAREPAGPLALTLALLALVRLLLPAATMPATTALGVLVPGGRELGLLAGANVVMPNLSPPNHRGDYRLYDGKQNVDSDLENMIRAIRAAGFEPDFSRGDPVTIEEASS